MKRLINTRFKVYHAGKGYWEIIDKQLDHFVVMNSRSEVRKLIRMTFTEIRNLPEHSDFNLNPMKWILP